MAAWPLVGALVVAGIWLATAFKIDEDRRWTREAAFRQATSLANGYAEQVRHTVSQIDQLTLNLKYDWEDPDSHVDLERKRAHGLFPEAGGLYASIYGADGELVTTSLNIPQRPPINDLAFFQMHKNGCCAGLQIWRPEVGRRIRRPIIRFTRRLAKPDGSFGGVAMVAAEPWTLVSFQDEGVRGPDDFVSVRLTTGPLLATRLGGHAEHIQRFYKLDPLFPTNSGIVLEPGDKFRDGKARIVAWRKLPDYPLVALAALSEIDALAPARRLQRGRYELAGALTLIVLLGSLAGVWLSRRLQARGRREEEIKATYRVATDAANECFYMIRPMFDKAGHAIDFLLEDCNERGATILGRARSEIIGTQASMLEPERFKREILNACEQALNSGFYEDELRITQPSPVKAAWVYRRMVRTGGGLALTMRDISEAKAHEQALSTLANNDALTGLPNRHWLGGFLPAAIKRTQAHGGMLAMLFIDLDNFKNVNDTLGHDAGDELLIEAARRLKSAVRRTDYVVRLGGDEFTVLLEHVRSQDEVEVVARAIIAAVAKPFHLTTGTGNNINASIGVSLYPDHGLDGESLLKSADIAMYAAKAAGKGTYRLYAREMSEALVQRLSKEQALRHAVELDQFVVHYQPRVGASTGRLSSMEALVRWMHPERGTVYPAEFIDLAEDIGLIVQLGELVIEKVCRQVAAWRTQGFEVVPVSINVSPHQLKYNGLGLFIAGCMERYDIPARLVEIELTESAVVDRSTVVVKELDRLRHLGVKLMIDDFGTGHSSLAQLHRLDVDVLKVDQAFTRALEDNVEGKVLFRAIVSMAEALDMCVVAEGVETSVQLTLLQSLACDEVQGYLVSRAVEAEKMADMLLKRFLLPAAPSAQGEGAASV